VQSDEHFLARLQASKPSQELAAELLRHWGMLDASVIEAAVRPAYEERYQYVDSGDVRFTAKVSVKRRMFDFTCEEDYPYATIMLGETYKLRPEKTRDLWLHMIFSHNLGCVALVHHTSRKHWVIERSPDSTVSRVCESYAVPKGLARFHEVKM